MKVFFSALSTLTILPLSGKLQFTASDLRASVCYFPFVGLTLGAFLAGLSYLFRPILSPLPLSVLLLLVSVIFTGALHLDGLADLWDGLGAGGAPERILSVMKESQIGAFGVIALVLVLLFKHALFFEIIDKNRWPIFLLMGLISRWAMALAAFLGKYPRTAGVGLAFIGKIGRRQILFATIFTALIAGFLGGGAGFVSMGMAALGTVSFVGLLKQKMAGLTGDGLGALNEKVEVLVMLLLLMIPPFGSLSGL